jgi:hypothetical protein
MGHGAGSRKSNAAKPPRAALPGVMQRDPGGFPGFTYLFGCPTERQRSQLGRDIVDARAVLGALVALLPTADTAVDSKIPSGYTYLLQFVSHDLVQTAVPFWAAADAGIASRNMRGLGLRLDTLYGGGPATCPLAFTPAGLVPDDRSKLRLGRVQPAIGKASPPGPCPFRDLPRVNLHGAMESGLDRVNFDDAFQVYVADPRNDDSVILAQLTVLFSIAHNAIADMIVRAQPDLPAEAVFGYARTAMLHVYYKIVANDLLPRLLCDHVWDRIASRDACSKAWLWDGTGMPLEFSHGALRFGHAMVRDQYVFSTRQPSPFTVGQTIVVGNRAPYDNEFRNPLPASWILEWARFFTFPETTTQPNYARRIAPRASSLDRGDLFRERDRLAPDGVTLRDALSSATAQTWTVDALAREIRWRCPDLLPPRWSPDDAAASIRQLLDGLASGTAGTPAQRALVSARMNDLCRDLPLSLFVPLEAAGTSDGKLGVLGSVIVGEVIGRLLAAGRRDLAASIGGAKAALGGDAWREIETLADMPALIRFAARRGGLADCPDMPFITA